MTKTALIAGGGIGGLTAGLALARQDWDVRLFEQADGFDEVGAGIQLSPNCVRVLHHLGLSEALSELASEPEALEIRHWQNGRLIARSLLGNTARSRFGYPYYHIHRADLLAVLTNQAGAAENIHLHANRRVAGYRKHPTGVTVRAGNENCTGDILIGADGIHSTVRARLFGEQPPRYTGNVAWRALIPADCMAEDMPSPTATVWWGPDKHFVHYYLRGGELINCVCVVEKRQAELESWHQPGDARELAREFAGWHPAITRLIDNMDSNNCFKWGLFDRPPMQQWSCGHVTLLGDACHPTLPFMAQGAAMAIEDGAVLAMSMGRFASPVMAFAEYERLRKPRTAWVQKASRRNARIFHMRPPLSRARDAVAQAAQRRIMTKLFDYDPCAT